MAARFGITSFPEATALRVGAQANSRATLPCGTSSASAISCQVRLMRVFLGSLVNVTTALPRFSGNGGGGWWEREEGRVRGFFFSFHPEASPGPEPWW